MVLLEEPLRTVLAGLATEVFLEEPLVRHKLASDPGLSLLVLPLLGGTASHADDELCLILFFGARLLSGSQLRPRNRALSLRLPATTL